MTRDDLIRKLSSRKFWAMLISLIVCICAFFSLPEAELAKIVALIGAFADIAIYMLSESIVDAANGTKSVISTSSHIETTTAKQTTTTLSKDLIAEAQMKAGE